MSKYTNADEQEHIMLENEMIETNDWVEVVRCKDCIHFKGDWCLCEEMPICGDDATTFEPDEDFFCSYGERRTEDETKA